ncbi:DUF3021 domain-containing protein [Brevibacterium sp. 50QC2O2]|jgi:hypothetical protein|uniref:DUF3021 domain-containing protein n=1 Tax=Brevibacterium TaxID=1696 RepID=UPI00211BC00A|nr:MULTISPECIES: DUF3021 domain-containing protein [unclassified Brevibacterium]MCQ9367229.1 DUF3021 domain-containing protein [Brevibacterium sp. 91QC2O2]MCQ9385635.1 DUF3021 domain-containing protein [Brevibacterium sp. 68QC2CO]MCQ9389538.1 DUF3021 domain-containing protein [Brevibacterium sp. 50QC2O2]
MIWRILAATVIPLGIMTAIGLYLLSQGEVADGRSVLCVGVIAGAVGGSAFIYQIERWSLLRQSLLHLGIMLVTVLPALLSTGWYDLGTAAGWWGAVVTFAIWGIGLWSILYCVFKLIDRRRARRESQYPEGSQHSEA